MAKITPEQKLAFKEYVEKAKTAIECLEFVLENIGVEIELNYSIKSFEELEKIYWKIVNGTIDIECLASDDDFSHWLGQYLGESIIKHTGAKWVQCKTSDAFGQPVIEGFGNEPWERVYPVEAALFTKDLPSKKPNFPGVRNLRTFAVKLEKALKIYEKSQAKKKEEK